MTLRYSSVPSVAAMWQSAGPSGCGNVSLTLAREPKQGLLCICPEIWYIQNILTDMLGRVACVTDRAEPARKPNSR